MKQSSGEKIVNHFGLIRLRVNGSGSLRMSLYSLDEVKSTTLATLTMQSVTNIEPTKLANFTQQRAKLRIKTITLNESFNISKIIIFAKPIAKSYPQ